MKEEPVDQFDEMDPNLKSESKMMMKEKKPVTMNGLIDGTSIDSPTMKLDNANPSPSPKIKTMKPIVSPSPSPSVTPPIKFDIDLSKMTERQQIAYLLRESNGMETSTPPLKVSIPIPPQQPIISNSTSSITLPEFIVEAPIPSPPVVVEKQEKEKEKEKVAIKSPVSMVKRASLEEMDETWGEDVNGKVKRRKKDKPSKKLDAARNGTPKPIKKQRKNEAICTMCEEGGNLLMCEGPCLRSFHADCLGLKGTAAGSKWECEDCSKHTNQCFFCKQKGEVGRDLMKCKVHQCGKFYHYKCVSQLKLAKLINSKAKRFNCPLHYCAACEVSGDGKQSVHCFRCPTAYHVICMPSTARLLTDKSKETRKTGLILCPKHNNEPPLASRDPGASLLDAIEAEMKEVDGEAEEGREEKKEREEGENGHYHYHNHVENERPQDSEEGSENEHKRENGLEDEVMKGGKRMAVDKAEEEVQVKRQKRQNGIKRGRRGSSLKKTQEIRPDHMLEIMKGSMQYIVPIVGKKSLDDVEREVLEEFGREKEAHNNMLNEQPQPPKQRQKKMEKIQIIETKFREELSAYKNNLVSMRDLMWEKNQMEFDTKVEKMRIERQRKDVEIEETLMRRFVDWGMIRLKQRQEEWINANGKAGVVGGMANGNVSGNGNPSSPSTPLIRSSIFTNVTSPLTPSPCPSLLASPVDASPSLPASPEDTLSLQQQSSSSSSSSSQNDESLEALMSLQHQPFVSTATTTTTNTTILSTSSSSIMMTAMLLPPLSASCGVEMQIEEKKTQIMENNGEEEEEGSYENVEKEREEEMEEEIQKLEETESILEAAATMIQF